MWWSCLNCLRYWHSICVPLPIKLPAIVPRKAVKMAQVLGPLAHTWETQMKLPGYWRHLGCEPAGERSFSLSLSASVSPSFSNSALKKKKVKTSKKNPVPETGTPCFQWALQVFQAAWCPISTLTSTDSLLSEPKVWGHPVSAHRHRHVLHPLRPGAWEQPRLTTSTSVPLHFSSA